MKHQLLILLYAIFCLSSCQENCSDALVIHYYQLDESLKKSNEFIDFATEDLISTMVETCKTKIQYYPWVDKARLVAKRAADLAESIDSLKAKMIAETGGLYTKEDALAAQYSLLEGLPKGAKNTSIANKTLLAGTYDYKNKFPKAVLLDQKIQALSSQYLDVLESCWEENAIEGSIFTDVRKKENTIQTLKDQFTLNSSKHPIITLNENQTWAETNFENKPLMLVLNNLTAIQNQLKTTQYVLVDFFSRQIERVNHDYDYDRFEILAYSPKPSVRLGETYKAEIALGAYSSKSIFEVVINQDTIHSIDGKAIYRVRPDKVGEQEYEAQISITYPLTGYSETFRKTFSFQVIP